MARVLIVGADGTIGHAVADALVRHGDQVIGTSRRATSQVPGVRMPLDLARDDVDSVDLPAVDAAVICAAMARFADCREQPERARLVNITAPAALSRRLVQAGARVVLLSTSAVFDCMSPRVPSDQARAPKSAYGTLKAEAETEILRLGQGASVLRLTKVLTPDQPLLVDWIAALGRGDRIRAFRDLTVSPISLDDVVHAVLAVLKDGAGGIYQVSGAEDVSYADVARHLARRLGGDPDQVEAVLATDHGIPAGEIARFTSLDTSRLTAATGFSPPAAAAVIDRVFGLPMASAGS